MIQKKRFIFLSHEASEIGLVRFRVYRESKARKSMHITFTFHLGQLRSWISRRAALKNLIPANVLRIVDSSRIYDH